MRRELAIIFLLTLLSVTTLDCEAQGGRDTDLPFEPYLTGTFGPYGNTQLTGPEPLRGQTYYHSDFIDVSVGVGGGDPHPNHVAQGPIMGNARANWHEFVRLSVRNEDAGRVWSHEELDVEWRGFSRPLDNRPMRLHRPDQTGPGYLMGVGGTVFLRCASGEPWPDGAVEVTVVIDMRRNQSGLGQLHLQGTLSTAIKTPATQLERLEAKLQQATYLLIYIGRSEDDRITEIQKEILAERPHTAIVLFQLARYYRGKGRHEKDLSILEKAREYALRYQDVLEHGRDSAWYTKEELAAKPVENAEYSAHRLLREINGSIVEIIEDQK